VGRGTSTYDGISIAWAVVEYLNLGPKPKVLFATHYFELTQLAGQMEGVKNYNVQAKEWKDKVIFLHKVAPGRPTGHTASMSPSLRGFLLKSLNAPKSLDGMEKEHQSLVKLRNSLQQEFKL